ncbi:AAA family ATPase [Nonomuraea rubra]
MVKDWWIFKGPGTVEQRLGRLAENQPPWRHFAGEADPHYAPPGPDTPAGKETRRRGEGYIPDESEIEAVNTALYLRRPLLVTGKPGVGKSTLAYSIATDLDLGPVLVWAITSRTSRRDGLYRYDAISRLNDANIHQLVKESRTLEAQPSAIAPYLRLGALGTALLPQERPRVLLIDEIDKSDIDLPGDLLTVFEEGFYEIPELARLAALQPRVRIGTHDRFDPHVEIERGEVHCRAFPIIILTSNGERDFPPPFLRRCIRLNIVPPAGPKLRQIIQARLGIRADRFDSLINEFVTRRADGDLATDQLLNAIQLRLSGAWSHPDDHEQFIRTAFQQLTGPTM